jgi:hypothetical protein
MVLINNKISNYTMFLLEFHEKLLYNLTIRISYCFRIILSNSSFTENSKTRTGTIAYKIGGGDIIFELVKHIYHADRKTSATTGDTDSIPRRNDIFHSKQSLI